MDTAGSIIVVGSFTGELDFDPGPGEDIHAGDEGSVFITKLDVNGTHVWTQVLTVNSSTGHPHGQSRLPRTATSQSPAESVFDVLNGVEIPNGLLFEPIYSADCLTLTVVSL